MEAHQSPASNHETGSLTKQSPHESRFIGSSSGVYFINTVKQAFETSGQQLGSGRIPAAEETVGGEDDFTFSTRNSPEPEDNFEVNIDDQRIVELGSWTQIGSLPGFEAAQKFAVAYFKTWHPLLPFLSGPEFLHELQGLYGDLKGGRPGRTSLSRHRKCYLIIVQCVMAMGAGCSSASVPAPTHKPSRSRLLSLVSGMATRHDILTIQLLLTTQLYFVSIMALRTASSLSGLVNKLLCHAGLHRCPYRYSQVSNEDRELRKRILWSFYVLDRYVCQALGIPVSLQDADIDVCVPGRKERHEDGSMASPNVVDGAPNAHRAGSSREIVLANFVEYAGLVGRSIQLFHASLHIRNKDPRKVLFLRSDVDKWYNSLPEEPKITPRSTPAEEQIARFLPFFHVQYEQLVISINRPSLSLPRSDPEFHHGLQATIRAAKKTITAMERQDSLFWPGYISSVWMSGLIISFACQIGLYHISQGSHEILRCVDLLKRMSTVWRSAQRCQAALSTLLSNLMQTEQRLRSHDDMESSDADSREAKRRRLDSTTSETPTSMSDTITGATPTVDPANYVTGIGDFMPPHPMTLNGFGHWEANDFFEDLSWNNLFDVAASSDPFFSGS